MDKKPATSNASTSREDKRAAALRANLRRRKQASASSTQPGTQKPSTSEGK